MLAEGQLHTRVLPAGENMNRWTYAWMIEHDFPRWKGKCKLLVQDFEGCLHCPEPLAAMEKVGLSLIEKYPTSSQDFNAIENCWHLLRERLYETMPTELETREDFIQRLRNAVLWLKNNHKETMLGWCTNQQERASEVLNKGGRCRF